MTCVRFFFNSAFFSLARSHKFFITPIIKCECMHIVINILSLHLLNYKSIEINLPLYGTNYTASITRPVHKPFFPPCPCTNFNLFSPLAMYIYDRKSLLNYNIDAFSLTDTLSNIFSCHFQKFFQKRINSHQGAR